MPMARRACAVYLAFDQRWGFTERNTRDSTHLLHFGRRVPAGRGSDCLRNRHVGLELAGLGRGKRRQRARRSDAGG